MPNRKKSKKKKGKSNPHSSQPNKPPLQNKQNTQTLVVDNSRHSASPIAEHINTSSNPPEVGSFRPVQPEQMSLEAYDHIQECMRDKNVDCFDKEDVTAVIQLAQHLRVFGLLSAVGYVRHAREGKIRERVRPIWTPLLWRLVCGAKQRPTGEAQVRQELMNEAYTLSTQEQKIYMATWRKGLKLSNYWNFWARACQCETNETQGNSKEDVNEQRAEDSLTAR